MELWIGLVNLHPVTAEARERLGIGAYANVLARAENEDDFKSRIVESFNLDGVEVDDFTDVEPFDSRVKQFEVSPEIRKLADEIAQTDEVGIDGFYLYDALE